MVPDLRPLAAGANLLEVRAQPANYTRFSGAVTMITFGGLGVAAGTTFLAVGCSNTNIHGMCAAGAITFPLTAAVLVPGIMLLSGTEARADVTVPTARADGPWLKAGPGYVVGAF